MESPLGLGLRVFLAFVFSLIFGHYYIPFLQRLKAGQSIREEGPKSHLSKAGTPTIGGLIFLSSVLFTTFVCRDLSFTSLVLFVGTLGFALVGFVDDYIKVINKRNLGFTALQKLLAQIGISVLLVYLMSKLKIGGTELFVPGLKSYINLGIFLIPIVVFIVVGTVNSVNLTDGLDGLASSVTLVLLAFFALVAYKLNKLEILYFCLGLFGALSGFLYFNKYPAKVFMGDTGSLALGGAVVTIALLLQVPLLLPVVGGIYFIETLSVILQVASFKLRGKRIFLMSPLHHHFEHLGYKETKIVNLFLVAEIVFCLLGYLLIF